jgi:uncharacterized protein YyaL (SSP411 family)
MLRSCFALLAILTPAVAAETPANRMAREASPYLLRHARSPVDWQPWGVEAFAKAKKEGKLVFLSSGFDACHWCHVMERETFTDKDVATTLNTHFVCIKIDREERPDIDHIYLTALHISGARGGWPLSAFLTADGKPIAGGSYWPPDDTEIGGRKVRGFKTVLKAVLDAWTDTPDQVLQAADELAERTKRALGVPAPKLDIALTRDLVAAVVEDFKDSFDPRHGGFGTPPVFIGAKFPRPPGLRLLQAEAARTQSKSLADMVRLSLDKMARGGIFDQLGGGFHRYSTERTWTIPHFEKMLPDSAQLLEVYARAYSETKDPLYRDVLRETAAFVARELTSPDGVFYAALDADSEGTEGRYYVWTPEELAAALPEPADLALAKKTFGLDSQPNFAGKFHVLALKQPPAEADVERFAAIRYALLSVRNKRPQPAVDTNVITGWNGLMIAGLARTGQALGDPALIDRAAKAADFLLREMKTPDGRLLRVFSAAPGQPPRGRLTAYLDDYADLTHGLLTLYSVTGDNRWLTAARALTDTMVKFHHDEDAGGFFYTAHDHEKLFARAKDQYDGAQSSGNSQASLNLVRLWQATGDAAYRTLAEKTFRAFAVPLKSDPGTLATLAEALAEYLDAPK